MANDELISRIKDLSKKCSRNCILTHTHFLTPAEQNALRGRTLISSSDGAPIYIGGTDEYERAVLFFLPYYMEAENFNWNEYISIIHATCHYGTPGHRDYLGALIGLGIRREFIGDIWILEKEAYIFCMNTIKDSILRDFTSVGRNSIKVEEITPSELPTLSRSFRPVRFTVSTPRLDAVVGGIFRTSRTEASRWIQSGKVTLNYTECIKTDVSIHEGDIISVRGKGKGLVESFDGVSHRGRMFIQAKLYI